MEIYNTTVEKLKQADTIEDGSPIPDGWTNLKPLWIEFEVFDKGNWREMTTAEKKASPAYKAQNNGAVKEALKEIDLASVRGIREWIAAQADCSEFTKTHEKDAKDKRKELIP